MTSSRLLRWLPPLLIIAMTLIFFRQLAFSDMILARGDTYNYFYPYWDVRNAAFRAGELPLWTNDLFMGTPLLANPQLGSYYPPNWLTTPFPAPQAIKISILLHSLLAGAGMMFLYNQVLGKDKLPALVAALVYSFSGYLGAHVEQINQLQGLAWLPLLLALYHRALVSQSSGRDGMLLGLAWALQIFSGHTQTVFITGIGLGLYGLGFAVIGGASTRKIGRALLLLAGCALIALLLALPQLLPSLELIGMSNRGGGFNRQEVISFSLPPNLLGRALLPGYDGQLFGEYIGYLGIIGLGLALWGMLTSDKRKWIWIAIAGAGLALALGRQNPLYLLLGELPGFNFFRVPARFLALYSLAMSLLAGLGVSELLPQSAPPRPRDTRRKAIAVALVIAGLILVTRFLLQPDPRLIFGASTVSNTSLFFWLLGLLILLSLLFLRHRWVPLLAFVFVLLELLLAAQNLPYNDLAPPEVYLGQRFTISQLLATQAEETAPGRTLSISQLYFDPGDIAALRDRYDRLGMGYAAQFHALDAVKKRETLMPNLPLTWRIPSIDGFGGGITPTINYSQFSSLLLPEGSTRAVDGRLGERMALPECGGSCIPPLRWLQMTDTQYLIVDKVYDIWHEGVAFDTSLADFWQDVKNFDWPDDAYDQAHILHSVSLPGRPAARHVQDGLLLSVVDQSGLRSVLQGDHSILALTLVRSASEDVFLQAQPPPWQRLLSSSIKIYRVPAGRSRAYLAPRTIILPDDWQGHEDALHRLRETELDVIHGDVVARDLPDGKPGQVEIVEYNHNHALLQVQSPAPAFLILADAHYPGWQASLNGQPVPILRANVMFRAVAVPEGASEVIFTFEPQMWRSALYAGFCLWAIALIALLFIWRRGK